MARADRSPRIHSANVVVDVGGVTRVWSFSGADARPAGSAEMPSDWALPPKLVGKGWAQLARPRMNIAWIADQPVFLQLVLLPTDDLSEVPAMIELQLEKLSPLPVGQIVWSYEVLGQRPASGGMPVLVAIAERSVVESTLASLEKRGFRADRVESPLLPLIGRTQFVSDGAYIFVFRSGPRQTCLIGWYADGALRALNVVNVTADERWVRQLVDELNRLTWAGELEGWASGPAPALHLVADEETLTEWRAPLEDASGIAVTPHVRPSDPELAAASVVRAAKGVAPTNLLPPEYAARYRQEYNDQLWMGGLGALFMAYLFGVLVYFGAVEVQKYRHARVAEELASVHAGYTNALRLKAQAQILQETVNLRFAALECWLATVEVMPEELNLESLNFSGGQNVTITGYAPADQENRISEFWRALQRKRVGNTNLFSQVQLRPTIMRTVQGVPQIQWGFNCTLQRPEI